MGIVSVGPDREQTIFWKSWQRKFLLIFHVKP
jgi:hypothetical protein